MFLFLDYGDDLGKKEKDPKHSEEKRKNIKSLIDKIPTDKASLFAHPVEWGLVDNVSLKLKLILMLGSFNFSLSLLLVDNGTPNQTVGQQKNC